LKSLPVNKYGGGRHIPPPVEFMCRPSSSLNKHDSTNHQPSPPALAIRCPRVLRYTALHCAKNSVHLEFSCEASPHKRRLKYDTNISPRRLMTHLLHQRFITVQLYAVMGSEEPLSRGLQLKPTRLH